jgi:hypothetical protein
VEGVVLIRFEQMNLSNSVLIDPLGESGGVVRPCGGIGQVMIKGTELTFF